MRRVLMTGYYEPLLPGSRTRTERFKYPIYKKPKDLIRVRLREFRKSLGGGTIVARCAGDDIVPYYTRNDIDGKGALKGRGLELFWLDDPVKAFCLHVQGSGAISLPSGEVVQVGYAAANGRAYRSIGRYLVENEILPLKDVTMESISDYLKENPGRMEEVLHHNQRL